jgi:hypothetical protein
MRSQSSGGSPEKVVVVVVVLWSIDDVVVVLVGFATPWVFILDQCTNEIHISKTPSTHQHSHAHLLDLNQPFQSTVIFDTQGLFRMRSVLSQIQGQNGEALRHRRMN